MTLSLSPPPLGVSIKYIYGNEMEHQNVVLFVCEAWKEG